MTLPQCAISARRSSFLSRRSDQSRAMTGTSASVEYSGVDQSQGNLLLSMRCIARLNQIPASIADRFSVADCASALFTLSRREGPERGTICPRQSARSIAFMISIVVALAHHEQEQISTFFSGFADASLAVRNSAIGKRLCRGSSPHARAATNSRAPLSRCKVSMVEIEIFTRRITRACNHDK